MNITSSIKRTLAGLLCAALLITFIPSAARADAGTVDDFVKRLYTLVLGRDCDEDGLKFWSGDLSDKRNTGICTAYGFFTSEEYTSKNKSDEEYIEDLYKAILGRDSDDEGKTYWVDVLKEQTTKNGSKKARNDIFGGFSLSPEFTSICENYNIIRGDFYPDKDMYTTVKVNLFINRLYTIVLGRDCDTDGLTYWTTNLLNGTMTGKEVAGEFFLCKEYSDKNVADENYVDDLYRTLMGRGGDGDGISFWTDQLQKGALRKDVFLGFADSDEFLSICDSYGITRGEVEKRCHGLFSEC